MIKEAYVNFDTAKLLKERGFGIKEETRGYYPIKGDATGRLMFGSEYHHNTSQVQIAAPTHQMATKWLRDVHDISIELITTRRNCWGYYVCKILDNTTEDLHDSNYFNTYEEAVEAALKYCLEHLI